MSNSSTMFNLKISQYWKLGLLLLIVLYAGISVVLYLVKNVNLNKGIFIQSVEENNIVIASERFCLGANETSALKMNCPNWITSLDGDIDQQIDQLTVKPLHLQPNYKSPCWYERLDTSNPYDIRNQLFSRFFRPVKRLLRPHNQSFTKWNAMFQARQEASEGLWRLRCLPYFYVIGQFKSGTTALVEQMLKTSSLIQGGIIKEPAYWNFVRWSTGATYLNLPRLLPGIADIPVPRPIAAYIDLFDGSAETARQQTVQVNQSYTWHPTVIGDFTAAQLTEIDGWKKLPGNQGLQEPRYTLPHVLDKLTPMAKIIVILRNPVDRLYSQYIVWKKKDRSPEDFHDLCVKAISLMEECQSWNTLRACLYNTTLSTLSPPISLRTSLYYPFIKDWLDVMGPDRMMVINADSYYSDTKKVTRDVLEFLGIEHNGKVPLVGEVNKSRIKSKVGPMLSRTRELLTKYYAPYNMILSELRHDESFMWR